MKLLGTLLSPAGRWLNRRNVRLLTAVLTSLLTISAASVQANTPFSGFTQTFNPATTLITLTPAPGAGLYHVGDSIGIETSNNTPIRVMGMDGSLVYSGAVTTLNLPCGHYFVETPGDRTQFVVLPVDYGNLDMLSVNGTGIWSYLDTLNNAFGGTWERSDAGMWSNVQTNSNTWNWSTTDARLAVVEATGRKIVFIGANGVPSWLNTNSSQYVQNLVTAYTNFMAAALTRYGTHLYAWEIFNEPSVDSLLLGTNDAAIAPTFLALAQGAKAVRDRIAPSVKLVGPSSDSILSSPIQWLQDNGINNILDMWSWHDYDSQFQAPDQDYPNLIPPCEPLNHRLIDALGPTALSKPSFVSEMGLFGGSALGCPASGPRYLSGLSWQRGFCHAIEEVVMNRAGGVSTINLQVGTLFANYPNDNQEIYGFDQAATGTSAFPRGPHPKTSAFLMTCYWLNHATYVDMRSPGTNVFLYAWRRADNTSMVVAWAVEGSTVPVNTNSTLTATDIFGNSITVSSLTETPVLFRSASSDASALLSNVMAALPPSLNLPPVLAPLENQSVLKNQLLQFTVSAADPDNDPVTYSAPSLPTGASLDPNTGIFSWTPTPSQLGLYSITVTATDARGLSDSATTLISVLGSATDGLIDSWKFDETSGTTTADSAGSAPGTLLNFSFTGASGWTTGQISNALAFDGINDYVSLNSSQLNLTNNFTVSAWLNPRNAAGEGVFFCVRSTYTVSGFRLWVYQNGLVVEGQTASGWKEVAFAPGQIQNGNWYHVVMVYDKSTVKVYVNGVSQTAADSGNPDWGSDFVMNPSGSTRIGAENGNFALGDFYDGVIDDLRVYNRTLIPAEILALYQAVDQPPVLDSISDQVVAGGQSLAFTLSTSGSDSATLTYSATGLPSGATLNASTGAFSWTPSLSQTGAYFVTFSVSDGSLSDSQSATITVSGNTVLLTVLASPPTGGTVSGGGSYAAGTRKQIAATPNSGWTFSSWNDGNTQNPRMITVASNGGTYTANLIQEIMPTTSGLGITNAVMQFNNLSVAVAGEASVFDFNVGAWASNTLFYTWDFGDGDTSNRSTSSTPAHVYTNCGPYTASVTVDDGVTSTNASFTVAVACQFVISKAQGKLNFAKTNSDQFTIKGTFDLPSDYSFAGKLATVDIGGATMSFTLDSTGKGRNGFSTFSKPSYNKKAGLWTFTATLKNGSWQSLWNNYGLVNADVLKPGTTVSPPITLVIDDEAFMEIPSLNYTARSNKSGTAK